MHHPKSTFRRALVVAASVGILAAGTASALAQSPSPSKPFRLIVPFPPGGGADSSVRMVADRLGKSMGVQVIVDNRAGAEGILAVNELRAAPPDGHTIMFGSPSALLYVPQTRTKPPYDPLRDIQPISHFTSFTYYLYVNDSIPVRTFAEFVNYVRKHPGKVAYGAGDATAHMVIALMAMHGKLDLNHIPYKGVTQATQDFAGGRIQVMVGSIDTAYQLKEKAFPLAVFTPQRSPLQPDVPTIMELGYPQVKLRPWTAFFAPAGTPKPVVDRLASEIDKVFRAPDLQEFFAARGSQLRASTPEAMRDMLIEQMPVWREAIVFAKVPIQD